MAIEELKIIQVIKDFIIQLQGLSGTGGQFVGQFFVYDYQVQTSSAGPELSKPSPFLGTVYAFLASENPDSKLSDIKRAISENTIAIQLRSGALSTIDLSVLDDPESTQLQRDAALTAIDPGARIANARMDSLYSLMRNIIMALDNQQLGSSEIIGRPFVSEFRKGDPVRNGEIFTVDGIIMVDGIQLTDEYGTLFTPDPVTAPVESTTGIQTTQNTSDVFINDNEVDAIATET